MGMSMNLFDENFDEARKASEERKEYEKIKKVIEEEIRDSSSTIHKYIKRMIRDMIDIDKTNYC